LVEEVQLNSAHLKAKSLCCCFAGLLKVVSARLSRAGAPLVVLANQHAFLFHLNMHCWLRVADDGFPASNFVTTWPEVSAPAETGELALLQAGVTGAAGQNFIWNR
jgi:protein HIRA/HIR1